MEYPFCPSRPLSSFSCFPAVLSPSFLRLSSRLLFPSYPSYVTSPAKIRAKSPMKSNRSYTTRVYVRECGIQPKVEKIRKTMMRNRESKGDNNNREELIMIDVIQRLGLEYYFSEDIHGILHKHYAKFRGFQDDIDDDLYKVALRFRLLRQNGYYVSTEVFHKFKGSDGRFEQDLHNDVKGLLNLYEASQLSVKGEDILDEASEFSAQLLKAYLMHNSSTKANANAQVIENTVKNPHHKNLARLMAKSLLSDFEVPIHFLHDSEILDEWAKEVQDLAKLDFNLAQTSHRNAVQQLLRWGRDMNLVKELDFARVEPIKWYKWAFATFTKPSMMEERVEFAKAVSLAYIIDDIFDVYGTLEELTLFTEAVNRWENADAKQLPDYMKMCFNALQKQTTDFSLKIQRKYDWNPEDSIRKLWADLCNAFLSDVKWSSSGQLPGSEEYIKNGIVSSGLPVVFAHAFFLLGQGLNKNNVQELNNLPPIVSATATIFRLWNDVGSDKNEGRDGHDLSYLDCYMKENEGCSYESARNHVTQMISDSWKCLNEEYMSPTSPFSMDFKLACLSLARMVPIVNSHDKTHHLQCLENLLDSPEDAN